MEEIMLVKLTSAAVFLIICTRVFLISTQTLAAVEIKPSEVVGMSLEQEKESRIARLIQIEVIKLCVVDPTQAPVPFRGEVFQGVSVDPNRRELARLTGRSDWVYYSLSTAQIYVEFDEQPICFIPINTVT